MADCGATGSALDRTVRAMGGSETHRDASKVLGSLLGQQQASLAEHHHHAMPQTAPHTLVMPPYNLSMPEHVRTAAVAHPAQQQQQAPSAVAAAAMQQRHRAQQQHMTPHMMHPGMPQLNPYHLQTAHHHQQQQQMMMMMNMQMQMQQQMIMAQQQQQQQQQAHQKPAAAKKQQAQSNFLEENSLDQETREALREHLESLGHEGLVKGAGIEELAAAWAEAEASYENDQAVENATNMAASIDPPLKEHYVFHHNTQQAPENVHSMDWMNEGMRHFNQGKVMDAIRCFETQLQHCNNDDARAWRMLGKCHAENDQDREAIQCLEEAVDRDPYATDALLALAVSHVNELNHQRALASLKAWITHNPKYAGMELTDDLYGDTTAAAAQTGDAGAFDEVQRLLLRALEFDPSSSSEILQTLGVTYNVNRDYDAAVKAFQRALDERPDDYQLWNKLGATLANGNQSKKALSAYNRALELRPRYARGWLNMAISYSNLQNYEEAARCYLQTLSLNPAATHCWSYLRIALSCSEKWDLIPLAAAQELAPFREHYDFVLYDPATSAPAAGLTD